MGSLIIIIVICVIIGTLGSIITESPLFLPIMFALGIMFGGLIASNEKVIYSDEKVQHELIAINGYYVDHDGNFITANNIRSKVSNMAIPENAVKIAPVLIERNIVYKRTFWKFGGKETIYEVVFPEGE